MSLIKLTSENRSKIDTAPKLIAEFNAPWCMYCKRLSPVITRLSEKLDTDIYSVDIDEFPDLAEKYKIDTIPSLLYFTDGVPGEVLVNPPSAQAIEQWIKSEE